mgnify:CR=1 FL=1
MRKVKLSDFAKMNGVGYRTVWNWLKSGKIKNYETSHTGRIYVICDDSQDENVNTNVFVYARVSSAEKKNDLVSQAKLCESFCASKGWQVEKTFKEVASGMNDNRKMLNAILEHPPGKLVVLYKDRLTRFGYNYLKKAFEFKGCEIVIVNGNHSEPEDLLKDFIAVITSFCCRLYGARRGQAKALKMKNDLHNEG